MVSTFCVDLSFHFLVLHDWYTKWSMIPSFSPSDLPVLSELISFLFCLYLTPRFLYYKAPFCMSMLTTKATVFPHDNRFLLSVDLDNDWSVLCCHRFKSPFNSWDKHLFLIMCTMNLFQLGIEAFCFKNSSWNPLLLPIFPLCFPRHFANLTFASCTCIQVHNYLLCKRCSIALAWGLCAFGPTASGNNSADCVNPNGAHPKSPQYYELLQIQMRSWKYITYRQNISVVLA